MPKRLDGANMNKTRKQVMDAFDSEAGLIVLDFADCDFIDSLGLSVIVTGLKLGSAKGKKMRMVHVGPEIRLLLQITRFDRICDIHDSMETATR